MDDPLREADAVLERLRRGRQDGEEVAMCCVKSDPGSASHFEWAARSATDAIPHGWRRPELNGYGVVSYFRRDHRGRLRKNKSQWTGQRLIMVDDLGTKAARSALTLPPTVEVETSPGNTQALFFLRDVARDVHAVECVIEGAVAKMFRGKDPGMLGVTRLFRLPGYSNTKPEYGGWRVKLLTDDGPEYALEELAEEWRAGTMTTREYHTARYAELSPAEKSARLEMFAWSWEQVQAAGLVRGRPHRDGWVPVTCPWVQEHSNGLDNGAAVHLPSADNGWCGGFVCHHGSHRGKKNINDIHDLFIDDLALQLEANNVRQLGRRT